MSNVNVIVSLVFEEMAEEENLFSIGRAAFLAKLYPSIDETQVKILEGIIYSRAEKIRCSPILLRAAFTDAYQIDDLKDLSCQLFDEAVMHLQRFMGAN